MIAATIVAVAVLIDAFFIEPYRIEVTHHSVSAPISAPLKIALISDVHARGNWRRDEKLFKMLDAENPDVILIAGDTLGRWHGYGDVVAFLRRLHAPLGVWLVRGNWEDGELPARERMVYASAGVRFLLNEASPIRPDVWLLGLDDPGSRNAHPDPALASVPKGAYTIAMFHSPAYFDEIAGRVPLAFAGHTHGGQARIPFVPVFWLPPGSGRFLEGWYTVGNSRMYVTRGIGTSVIYARFLCRPELSIITLEPESAGKGETPRGSGTDGGKPQVRLSQVGLPHVGLSLISPGYGLATTGGTRQFSATVRCTDLPSGAACPQGVQWSASIGAIDANGRWTAPSSPGRGAITATSMADPSRFGTAAVAAIGAYPAVQGCHAQGAGVTSLSCTLPSLSAGHTLVAVVRAHGSTAPQLNSFSDSVDGTWPQANLVSAGYTSSIGVLSGGATFLSNTEASSTPVRITAAIANGVNGDELDVWDFPGVYALDGPAPTPLTGVETTPKLASAKAGDLVFAWSVRFGCFQDSPGDPLLNEISIPGSCFVDAAAAIPATPRTNVSDRFSTEGAQSVSGIMALTPKK
jgi:predicted MPP superfamily phosphohydrolase